MLALSATDARTRKTHPDGSLHVERIPPEQWPFLLREVHPGYLTWDEYEANLHRLQQNRPAYGEDRRHGPAREGPALLQGLVICGRCGNRMTLRYYQRKHGTRLYPEYLCQKEQIEQAGDQSLPAGTWGRSGCGDHRPVAGTTDSSGYRHQRAGLRRIAHPGRGGAAITCSTGRACPLCCRVGAAPLFAGRSGNRLVASVLEADWNARLRELAQVQEEAERQNVAEQRRLTALEQQAIAELVNDFPRVWQDPRTSDRDRKRMVRFLLEDVTRAPR